MTERGKVQQVATRIQQQIEWRRSKVLEYLSQGMSQTEIANKLQFDKSTISLDVAYLRQQAKERIRHHIEDRLPLEFEKSLASLEQLKQKAWAIMEKENLDERTKLQAIEVVMSCDAQKMDLLTHVGVIEHSINFVENANKKLDSMRATTATSEEDEQQEEEEKAKKDNDLEDTVTNSNDIQGSSENHSTEGTTTTTSSTSDR